MTQPNAAETDSTQPQAGMEKYGRALSASEVIEEAIVEAIEDMGFELVAVDWAGAARHRVVRVYLDRPTDTEVVDAHAPVGDRGDSDEAAPTPRGQGISLDEITRLSPVVSNALDAAEADPACTELQRLLKAGYTLEVSSPGIERPLARGSHFERFMGRRITVRTFEPLDAGSNQRTFHGFIRGYEANAQMPDDPRGGELTLDEADGAGILRIPLPAIKRAHLVYEN